MLRLISLSLFCFEGSLLQHRSNHRLSVRSDHKLIDSLLSSSDLVSGFSFLLLSSLHFYSHFSLLFLLTTAFLFVLSLFFGVFPFKTIFFFFDFPLASLLALLFFQIANQAFTRD